MAQVIKIKRSTGSAAPETLAQGELAYSKGSDTFYIGDPASADNPLAIGPAIKNNAGTLALATGVTAGGIHTLLNLVPGTDILAYDDNLQSFVDTFTLPTADGSNGQVLTTNGSGTLSFSSVSVSDVDVNEPNLRARLAELTEDVTIGDAETVTVTIAGNLVVSGTTTTLNTQELLVEDNIITLNSGLPAEQAPSANAGIEVNRGSSTNTAIRWNETSDAWEFTNDGTTYNVIGYGDITSVEIQSTDGSITGIGTGESGDLIFDLEVGTIDGGTYGT